MEKISRKEAVSRGQITYFTGEECKHGHVAYRYVKNGACSECVKSANGTYSAPDGNARREAKEMMVTVKVRGFQEDRETLSAAAYGLAVMRSPVLLQGDVDPRALPQGREPSGTALFSFLCFQEDVDTLRQIANRLTDGRRVNVDTARKAAFNEAAKWA